MLYGCDYVWWERNNGVPEFKGLKVSQDPKIENHRPGWHVHKVRVVREQDKLLTGTLGVIGWGGNGGFQTINLAVQFGSQLIALVGFDMRLDKGSHWHGTHPRGLNNPTAPNVARWRRVVDEAHATIKALGITVVNLSPVSSLVNYPKMNLDDALTLAKL